MTNTLTAGEKRLIKALAATGQPKVMIHVNARRTWSLAFGAPGWKAQTFLSLADRGYLHIEYGFSGRKDVSLTDLGRAALDAPESSLPPMKLSDVQSKVLARVAAGEVTWRHAGWRDKPFGGINVTSTVKSLARRGLIDDGTDVAVLTNAGRDALNGAS